MPDRPLRIALLARSVHPLHGVGGLERHVYDLVRHLIAQGAHITLITKPPLSNASPIARSAVALDAMVAGGTSRPASAAIDDASIAAAERFGVLREAFRLITVPYVTFPGAGKRGTTVLDRSTAYPLFGWRAGREAVKLARRGDVDIVHALGASGLGYALARQRHEPTRPFVFNPQGLEEFGATDPRRARLKRAAYAPLQIAVRACAKAADVVIATDRALVPTVLKHLPIDASRVEVVPNAIDLTAIDRYRHQATATTAAALRARFGIDAAVPVILSVGRLEENKGFHVAARALGELLRRDAARPKTASTLAASATSNWRWVLVGDGPYRPAIERIAAAEGLGSRMIVTGRAPDDELHAWYETAALFVHPTLYEGSSLVTLEAMAHERAVVATRAGGLPDKVHPGVNGWLVDPDRADLLADALTDALHRDRAELARFGRASRDIVERDFAWPVVAARMMAVYHNLLTN
jgi:glycosyltransferase involved in cell wall biosynthesis